MPFKNLGQQLENSFISFFDGRRLIDIPPKWRKHFKRMFPDMLKQDTITAYKYADPTAKPDIVFEVKGVKKLISLKSGKNPSIHQEYFKYFFEFLRDLNISVETRRIISLYHFGTSKYYGCTGTPLNKDQIVERFHKKIYEANLELNKEEIIEQIVERSVFEGARKDREKIDYLYYGSFEKGFLASPEQIIESIKSRKEISESFIHIGELTYQPSGRRRDKKDFLYSRIHWPILTRLYYDCLDEDNFLNRRDTSIVYVPMKDRTIKE